MTPEEFEKVGPVSKRKKAMPAYCPRCVAASVVNAEGELKPKPHRFSRPDYLRNHLVAYHHVTPLEPLVFVTLKGQFLAPASLRPATEEEINKRTDALEKKKKSTRARLLKKAQEERGGEGDIEGDDPTYVASPPHPGPRVPLVVGRQIGVRGGQGPFS